MSIDLELNDAPDIPDDPRIFDMVDLPWDMRVVIMNADYIRTGGPGAHDTIVAAPDVFRAIKDALVTHLGLAREYLLTAAQPSVEAEQEEGE